VRNAKTPGGAPGVFEAGRVAYITNDLIRKSGNRFSEKVMLKQRDKIMMRFYLIAS
jgi:hypothetical protein